jgi:hypothetical protein
MECFSIDWYCPFSASSRACSTSTSFESASSFRIDVSGITCSRRREREGAKESEAEGGQ